MKIAVDVDDVLTKTGANYIKYHNEKYGTNLKPWQFYDYEYLKPFGLDRREGSRRILDYIEERALEIEPLKGARKVLEELKKNHELIVITGRAKNIMKTTGEWIDHYFPDIFSHVVCTDVHQLNGGKDKGEICRDLGVNLLIDDYLKYAQECSREGIRVLLLAQPWNVNEQIESNLIDRVESWDEVAEKIEMIK